jgi:hypothetical protein
MKCWYVVVYDVAGGIDEWIGPLRWTKARNMAKRYERGEYVRQALVCESLPSFNKRYLLRNHE